MSKHTPGPWNNKDGLYITDIYTKDSVLVASAGSTLRVPSNINNAHEREANARLIAAAPEMYTAVKNLAECMKNEPDGFHPAWIEQINRILAKIDGKAP